MDNYEEIELEVCIEFSVQSDGRELSFRELEDKSRAIAAVIGNSELSNYLLGDEHYSFDDNIITLNFEAVCSVDLDAGEDSSDAELLVSELIDDLAGKFAGIGCEVIESDVSETSYTPQQWADDLTIKM